MPSKSEATSFNKMRTIFFFALIIILGLGVIYILKPFFYPIFWAAIMAVTFHSTYRFLAKHLHSPALGSLLTLLLVLAVIIIPLIILIMLIINQSSSLYQSVSQGNVLIQVQGAADWLGHTPLAPYLNEIKNYWTLNAQNITQNISLFLFDNLRNITQNSLTFLGMFLIMLYALYFFFKDGPRLLKRLMHLSPLGDRYETMLYERFTSTTRATLKGTLLVGLVQGSLGGIVFYLAGVQGALIWGLIMAAASIVPALGSSIVWLPAGIIALALGNVWQGLMILILGAFLISTIDNLLRPKLVGKDIQMHPLLVLFSTLGGIFWFGISGVVIGPVIAALFLAVISIYDDHYSNELGKN